VFDGALQACAELIYCISGPCKPAWRWRSVRRGHASPFDASEDFDRALQTCLTLAKCSTGPCKPAWSWRRLRRGHASLHDAGEDFDEAMQACAELIYCISRPHLIGAKAFVFPLPGYICRR